MRGQLAVLVIHQQVLQHHGDIFRDDVVDGAARQPITAAADRRHVSRWISEVVAAVPAEAQRHEYRRQPAQYMCVRPRQIIMR